MQILKLGDTVVYKGKERIVKSITKKGVILIRKRCKDVVVDLQTVEKLVGEK